jgi:Chaperone of endosialidase
MPFETTLDLLTLRRDGVEESQWPRLSCSQAQQAALEGSDLRLDAGHEVLFQDQGQLRVFDDTHKLVFNRAGNLLELHEQGDIRLLTGAPTPSERLRILATGQVGLGTPTPTQALDVVGTVKATAFEGNGAGLTGVRGIDSTKVAKAGDTMTGPLTLTAAGTGLSITNNAAVGGTLTVTGNVGIGTTAPLRTLQIGSSINAAFTFEPADVSPNAGYIRFGDQTGWKLHFGRSRENSVLSGAPLNTGTTGVLMTLQDNGNVGIGTTSPATKLEVVGNWTGEDGALRLTGDKPTIRFSGGPISGNQSWILHLGGNGPGNLEFYTQRTGLSLWSNVMVLAPTGNVGIGTSNPAFQLDVTDRIRLRDGPNGSAGLWLFQSGRNVDRAFVGMATEDIVGLWGNGGVGWALQMDVNNGTVYIGSNKTGPFVRFNDDLWFSDPQNGTIHTRNGPNTGFGTMVGFFQPPSSREFKKEIRVLQGPDLEQLLAQTLQTDLVHFRYKSDEPSHRLHLGVIAEDAPDMIVGKDGQSIAISEYVAMLHGAIKALASRFAELRTTKDHLNASGQLLQADIHDVDIKLKGGAIQG